MAFGKSKQPQSYGVPVRPAVPPAPPVAPPQSHEYAAAPAWQAASVTAAPPWESAPQAPWQASTPPAAPAGYYAPVTAQPPSPYATAPSWTPGYQQQQYLPPFPMTPQKQQSGFRRVLNSKPVAGVIVVLVLLGIGNAIRNGADQTGPITVPLTVNGLAQVDDPRMTALMEGQRAELQAINPGIATALATYANDERTQFFVLVAVRARLIEKREVARAADLAVDESSRRSFPHGISCYTTTGTKPVAMCIHPAQMGFVLFRVGADDLDSAAGVTQQVRAQLH